MLPVSSKQRGSKRGSSSIRTSQPSQQQQQDDGNEKEQEEPSKNTTTTMGKIAKRSKRSEQQGDNHIEQEELPMKSHEISEDASSISSEPPPLYSPSYSPSYSSSYRRPSSSSSSSSSSSLSFKEESQQPPNPSSIPDIIVEVDDSDVEPPTVMNDKEAEEGGFAKKTEEDYPLARKLPEEVRLDSAADALHVQQPYFSSDDDGDEEIHDDVIHHSPPLLEDNTTIETKDIQYAVGDKNADDNDGDDTSADVLREELGQADAEAAAAALLASITAQNKRKKNDDDDEGSMAEISYEDVNEAMKDDNDDDEQTRLFGPLLS